MGGASSYDLNMCTTISCRSWCFTTRSSGNDFSSFRTPQKFTVVFKRLICTIGGKISTSLSVHKLLMPASLIPVLLTSRILRCFSLLRITVITQSVVLVDGRFKLVKLTVSFRIWQMFSEDRPAQCCGYSVLFHNSKLSNLPQTPTAESITDNTSSHVILSCTSFRLPHLQYLSLSNFKVNCSRPTKAQPSTCESKEHNPRNVKACMDDLCKRGPCPYAILPCIRCPELRYKVNISTVPIEQSTFVVWLVSHYLTESCLTGYLIVSRNTQLRPGQ